MKKKYSLLLLLILFSCTLADAQSFRFLPDEYSNISTIKSGGMVTTENERWTYMNDHPTTWPGLYTYKSVRDIVSLRVNRDITDKVPAYRYLVNIQIDKRTPGTLVISRETKVLYVSYVPDALQLYNDLSVYTFEGAHAFNTTIVSVFEEATPGSGYTILVPLSQVAANLQIETKVVVQRYDLERASFVTGSKASTDKRFLDVWGSVVVGGPLVPMGAVSDHYDAPTYKPAMYELEWTYIDDYQFNTADNTRSFAFPSTGSIPFDFRKNSTRVQLDQPYYSIPLIYEHGAILFRFRIVRPDKTRFKDLEYGDWSLGDYGTLPIESNFRRCGFMIESPHTSDSLNWQYTINFAEQGKYKHVINYFDGALKDRQTQTKINSNAGNIIAVEKVYDYEGRPSIVSLPTPVAQEALYIRNDILTGTATGMPFRAPDFDRLPGCSKPDSFAKLANTAVANIYYSTLNPDKSDMQQFVPDAEGFPLVQTIYSPDNTNKVSFQGGAGLQQQLWRGHGTQYEYVRANQPEMDRLLGTEAGYDRYYPKQIVTDPNGQSSYSILNPAGKVIISALQGAAPSATDFPISPLENFVPGQEVCADLLRTMPQEKSRTSLSAATSLYNDGAGNNTLTYSVLTKPFPTACAGQYLWAAGTYDVQVTDDCGSKYTALSTTGTVGAPAVTATAGIGYTYYSTKPPLSANLPKGKVLVNKTLSFSEYDIRNQVKGFVKTNEGKILCYHPEPYFIRNAVEATEFPCVPVEGDDPADLTGGNDCEALRKQMIKEMYPGAKYGQYTRNPDGTFADAAENSIFTVTATDIPLSGTQVYASQQGITAKCDVRGCQIGAICASTGDIACGCGDGAHPYTSPCCSDCMIRQCKCINFKMKKTSLAVTKIEERVGDCVIDRSTIRTRIPYTSDKRWEYGISNVPITVGELSGIWDIYVTRNYYISEAYCSCREWHAVSGSAFRKYNYGPGMAYYGVGDAFVCTSQQDIYYPKDRCMQSISVPDEPIITYDPGQRIGYGYQSPCITLPAEKWYKGKKYTNLATIDPDQLIEMFDDQIAAALLPLHPEYCKLQNCELYSGAFERKLQSLETWQQAEVAGMFKLTDIIAQDPLKDNYFAGTEELQYFPFKTQVLALAYGSKRPYGDWTMDKLARAIVYCGAGNDEEMRACAETKFKTEITAASPVFATEAQKQQYFDILKNLYIATRNSAKQGFIDYDNTFPTCGPCKDLRLRQTGEPLFDAIDKYSVYDNGSMTFGEDSEYALLPEWKKLLINKARTRETLTGIPPDMTAEYKQLNQEKISTEVQSVTDALKSCGFIPPMIADIHDELAARLSGGQKLTPEVIKDVITPYLAMMGKGLNDLCHPFLVAYDLFPDEKQVKAKMSGFACGDAATYNGLGAFLNSPEIKTLIEGATTSWNSTYHYSSRGLTTAPTNMFISKVMDHFGYPTPSMPASYALNVAAKLVPVIPGCNTMTPDCKFYVQLTFGSTIGTFAEDITLSIHARNAAGDLRSFLSENSGVNIGNAQCVNDDPEADNTGLITQKTAVIAATCPSCITPQKYYVWNSAIDFMSPAPSAASLQNALTCVDIKNAISDFNTTAKATYAFSEAANHPLFEQTLNNYLNTRFNKKYPFQDYLDLMEGCAVTDKVELRKQTADALLEFTSEAAANTFETNINALGTYRPGLFRYKMSSGSTTPTILVDLSAVAAADLTPYMRYMSGASGTGVPALTGVSTYTPNYTAAGNMLFTAADCTFSIPATATGSTTADVQVYENGAYRAYKRHLFQASGTTPLDKANLFANLNNTLHGTGAATECNTTYAFWTNEVLRPADYSAPLRQQYLAYIYGLSTGSVIPAIDPAVLGANLSSFTGKTFTYDDPYCKGSRKNLYAYTPNPTTEAGYNLLKNTILPAVTGTFGPSAQPFPNAAATVKSPALSVYRKANGDYWYRYFDADDKLLNIYITPPARTLGRPAEEYTISAVEMGPHPNTFFITVSAPAKTVAGITLPAIGPLKCNGYTSFTLSNQSVLATNLILDKSDKGMTCFDSLDCESDVLANAILNGKAAYYQYFESTVNQISTDMMTHLVTTSKDTLIYCGRQQQYQQTLYYYDRVGNLTRTVPPAGVVPLTSPTVLANVEKWRIDPAAWRLGLPATCITCPAVFYAESQTAHNKISTYTYNSLNQLTAQRTPDGGEEYFFYDAAGRQIFSQNSRQRPLGKYAYSLYDAQGRPSESGEVVFGCADPAAVDFTNLCPFTVGGSTVYSRHPDFITRSYDENTYAYASLRSFIGAKQRREVVRTFYDVMTADLGAISTEMLSTQENLRSRVAAIKYYHGVTADWVDGSNSVVADFATYYSYDLSGNVQTITYDFPKLKMYEQRYKRVDYDYDLISGKVNMISYNRGHPDQFYQQYDYDADNRITKVNTSSDGLIWNRDAAYSYYKHGPLARLQLGDQKVQSLEYAYTIQGWLKAINGDVLNPQKEMGKNGLSGDKTYPADVIAHALRYFDKDYTPIGTTPVTNIAENTAQNLYNGNITQQTTGIGGLGTMQRTYQYDQLQRLKLAANSTVDDNTLAVSTPSNLFKSAYSYDRDGNINTLSRFDGQASPVQIDNFTYTYDAGAKNNKLLRVSDAPATPTGGSDLQPGQVGENYTYDKTGNLVGDKQAGSSILWDRFGKVTAIRNTLKNPDVSFGYDGRGNRIWKEVLSANNDQRGEYYVRDAGGNILATYETHAVIDRRVALDWMTHVAFNAGGTILPDVLKDLGTDFSSGLMGEIKLRHSGWLDNYTSKPLSFYLSADPGIKSRLLYSGVDWIDGLRAASPATFRAAFLDAGTAVRPLLSAALDYNSEGLSLLSHYSSSMSPLVCNTIWQSANAMYSPGDRTTAFNELTRTDISGENTLYDALATLANTAYPTALRSLMMSTRANWMYAYAERPMSYFLSADPYLLQNILFNTTDWVDALTAASPAYTADLLVRQSTNVEPFLADALNYNDEGKALLGLYSKNISPFLCDPIWQTANVTYSVGDRATAFNALTGTDLTGSGNALYDALGTITDGTYTTALRSLMANSHNDWLSGYTDKSVGFFMGIDNTLKTNLLSSGETWIDALRNYSPVVHRDALLRSGTTTVRPFFTATLNYPTEGKKFLQQYSTTMPQAVCQAIWSNLQTQYIVGNHVANGTNLYNTLNNSPGMKPAAVDQLLTRLAENYGQGQLQAGNFYTAMINDNTIWQSSLLRAQNGPLTAAVRTVVDRYSDQNALRSFFDTWSGGPAALAACTAPDYKLNALYSSNPALVKADMAREASRPEIASILTSDVSSLGPVSFGTRLINAGAPEQQVRAVFATAGSDPAVYTANATALFNTLSNNPQLKPAITGQMINAIVESRFLGPDAASFYTDVVTNSTIWQSYALRYQNPGLMNAIRGGAYYYGGTNLYSFFDGWNGAQATLAQCTPWDYKINTVYNTDPTQALGDMAREASRPEIATLLTGLNDLNVVDFGTKLVNAGVAQQLVDNAFAVAAADPATHTANAVSLITGLSTYPQLKPLVMDELVSNLMANQAAQLPGAAAFYDKLLADNTIWQSAALSAYNSPWTTAIRDITNSYVSTGTLTGFFDSWSGGTAALFNCTTPEFRLSTVYAADPVTATRDMTTEVGTSGVVDILYGMTGLTVAGYRAILSDAGIGMEQLRDYVMVSSGDTIKLAEHHIYGSSRLGVQRYDSTAVLPYQYGTTAFIGNIVNPVDPVATPPRHSLNLRVPWYSYSYADLIDSTAKEPVTATGPKTCLDKLTVSRTLGRRYYELSDHLGNVLATVLDRKTGSGSTEGQHGVPGTEYDHWAADIASATDYYPGGMMMPGRNTEYSWSRMGAQNSPKDDEVYGKGNFVDMGGRHLDTRIIRTPKIDDRAAKYASLSPYAYVANSFPNAKDPDGNVVLFINGQHAGSGGTAGYWGGYDQRAMSQIGDNTARYIDGALGGWTNTALEGAGGAAGAVALSKIVAQRIPYINAICVAGAAIIAIKNRSNISMESRIDAGKSQGYKDAASIIANLSEGETIKVVTHSMGTGYARGYVQGVIDYANGRPGLAEKLKFVYELDVNSFQGKDLPALPKNIVEQTDYKLGGKDGGHPPGGNSVPTVSGIPGATNKTYSIDMDKGHAIDQMSFSNIPYVGGAGTETKKPIEQGNNNGN